MTKRTNKIVVLSGKGGTGKTTVSAAFNELAKNNVTVDCDVDAADLFIILNPEISESTKFIGGKKAKINIDLCNGCGLCEKLCRFDAISNQTVDYISCEGCGLCYRACPNGAIEFESVIAGDIYNTTLKNGNKFYYAALYPGESNSGKLVTKIKEDSKYAVESGEIDWLIMDGPPGIGCPVNASIAGVDMAVIVTEPTQSGIHDLKRLIGLLQIFKIESGVIINKYDLNEKVTFEIENYLAENGIEMLGKLSYDYDAVKALQNRKTIVNYSTKLSFEIQNIWKKLNNIINLRFK